MVSPRQLIKNRSLVAPVWIVLSVISLDATADEFDTFQLNASVNKISDNNIFRRNTGETSDDITIKSMGVKIDKQYSLQRVMLDWNFLDYKYNRSSFLDYQASNYSSAFLWSLTPSLTGTISADRTEVLNDFRDYRTATPIQNIRTTKINKFRAEYSPHHVWSLIAGVTNSQATNSQQFNAQANFDATAFDYGAKYLFPSGAYVTVLGHKRRGEYKNRQLDALLQFDNGYDENEFEVDLVFKATGKSSLSAKVGHIEREYDNFTLRNYDAYIGHIDYKLMLTGKIRAGANLSRLVAPYEQATSTYSSTDMLRGDIVYALSDKLELTVNAKLSEREFTGRGQFDTSGRKDEEKSISGSVKWTPIKNISFSLSETKSSRNSNQSQFDFDDTLTSINVDLKI